jgi:hypothetical protein
MKNVIRLSILVALVLLIAVPLASCAGAEGPEGPQGPEGAQGPEGPQGPAGVTVGFIIKESEAPYTIPGVVYLDMTYYVGLAGLEPDEEVILSTFDYPDGNLIEVTTVIADSRGIVDELISLPSSILYDANAIYAWVDDNGNTVMDDGELRACLPCYVRPEAPR